MITNCGEHPETGLALCCLILRDAVVKALHPRVDNMVTLRLSSILEDRDPQDWAGILGSSDRLKCLILSHLRYNHNVGTGVRPAIPIRTYLRSLVLGNGNGRGFIHYMIQELKAPALLSLDLFLLWLLKFRFKPWKPEFEPEPLMTPTVDGTASSMSHGLSIVVMYGLYKLCMRLCI
jgi:hypothetical protein